MLPHALIERAREARETAAALGARQLVITVDELDALLAAVAERDRLAREACEMSDEKSA